jgi:tetratricopeptide (TPR) repeat protein
MTIRLASLAIAVALTGTAYAQSQAEIAERLNEEGKTLMRGNQYAEASKKFQEAVARVPEAKYFFNLCVARTNEGLLDDAITACRAVDLNNPPAELKAKTEKMVEKINDIAKSQGIPPPKGTGGGCQGTDCKSQDPNPPKDPTHPVDPNPPKDPTHPENPPRVAEATRPQVHYAPPSQNLVMASTPDNRYTWTLGIDLFGGGGQVGQPDFYGSAVGGVRLKGDYMMDQRRRLGAQVYFQYSHFGQGKNDALFADTLDIFDIGLAGYKHVCLGSTPRLCVTPLLGVHLSLMSPANEMDSTGSQVFNYAGVGARGELSFAYAFGQRFEHVLSLMVGANAYSAVLSGPSASDSSGSLTATEAGLDKGGVIAYLGLGYTYRFNTPLGGMPFVTLE